MAMNITAISYVSRRLGNARQVFLSALLYITGQTLAYLGLAFVLIAGAKSTPLIALFLQKYMHLILGPILIVVGMFLLQLIHLNMTGRGMGERLRCLGRLGRVFAGRGLRFDILPDLGILLFRQPDSSFAQGEFQYRLAVNLWHRHRAARDGLCRALGLKRSIGGQSLQHPRQDRMVGTHHYRLDLHTIGRLLFAEIHFRSDLKTPLNALCDCAMICGAGCKPAFSGQISNLPHYLMVPEIQTTPQTYSSLCEHIFTIIKSSSGHILLNVLLAWHRFSNRANTGWATKSRQYYRSGQNSY